MIPGMTAFERPSARTMRQALALLRPLRRLASPVFHGLDGVPASRPLLFVGNHTIYGVLDVPFLFAELYEQKGIFLRSLGDHAHFKVPGWRDFLTRFGTVDGTRANCARLMQEGECILVFPGGGREVAKRKGERYQLIWKNRLGFARLAIAHGCTIVPFSAVGVDDAFDILVDGDDVLATPLGRVLRRLGVREEALMPIPLGFRPERLYFRFGRPISTRRFRGQADDEARCRELRDQVQAAVADGIRFLLAERERDPDRALGARLRRRTR